MVSQDTLQFIYRVFAIVIAVSILSVIGIDAGSIFHFGDGEAIKLIDQLNGPLVAMFSALSVGVLGHQALTTVLTRGAQQVQSTTVTTTGQAAPPPPPISGATVVGATAEPRPETSSGT